MRILLRILLGVSLLLVLAAAGVAGWLYSSLPRTEGEVALPGLDAPVHVVRDGHGVPHIFAASDRDAWFALGYVHAQDRLWQMEAMRRAGAGRLAEIIGERALRSDRFMRTLGLHRLVESQWQAFDAEARRPLEAYAAGVNAWLDGRSGALPAEFLALRFSPEPWRPTDSLLWARLMGLRLAGNWRDELLRARLLRTMPEDRVRELWPAYPADAPVTTAALAGLPGLDRLAADLPDSPWLGGGASNAWAVAGGGTESGKPVLANDPHLGFGMPILWYLARVEAPGLTLSGATVPGVPYLILGHNGAVAWGLTTTHSDTEDLFVERISAVDPAAYDTPDGPRPFVLREERIAVRDADDVVMTVRETRHGPVVSDLLSSDGEEAVAGTVLALASTALRPEDPTPHAIQRLNHAGTVAEALAAMANFTAPQQNLMVADTAGAIAFQVVGLTPVRATPSFAPAPGWTGDGDWTGFIPFADMPRVLDPPSGRIVNANNAVVGPDFPYDLGSNWAPPYRARRIEQALAAEAPHGLDAAARLQADTVSLMARDLMAALRDAPVQGTAATRALDMLRAWDGSFAVDRPEPLVFMVWLREFTRRVFADDLGAAYDDFAGVHPQLLLDVLDRLPHWCDDAATLRAESCDGLAAAALSKVVAELSAAHGADMARWRWGDVHHALFDHPVFDSLPLLGSLANRQIETPGGQHTVNVGAMRLRDDDQPFAHVHGAGFRGVYDLADLSRSRLMIATGQSGNLLSPHYDDLLEPWRDGRYLDLGADRQELERAAQGILRLVPAPR